MIKFLICSFIALVLNFSLSAEGAGGTPREIWESVKLKDVKFQQTELPEVVAYLNDAMKKQLGRDNFPHVRLDMQQKGGLNIIRHDHEQQERNTLADLKIQSLLEGRLKEKLEALSSPGQDERRPFTLELRNVQAYDALRTVVDISGLSLVYLEADDEWLITENQVHVDLVPVPEMLQEIVNEIFEDGLDVNLMDLFSRHSKWWQGYIGVLNRETLLLIAPESDYAQAVKGLEDLPKREDRMTRWNNGWIYLPWKKQMTYPESKEAFLRELNALEWEALWQAYLKLKIERAKEEPVPNPADPFGFGPSDPGPPRPVEVFSVMKNDHLSLELVGESRFEVSYSRRRRPGKFFSDTETVTSRMVALSHQEIAELFSMHLEGRRDELWERLKGLDGEVEVYKSDFEMYETLNE